MYSAGQLLAPVVKLILAFPAVYFLMARELCFEDMITKLNLDILAICRLYSMSCAQACKTVHKPILLLDALTEKLVMGLAAPLKKW